MRGGWYQFSGSNASPGRILLRKMLLLEFGGRKMLVLEFGGRKMLVLEFGGREGEHLAAEKVRIRQQSRRGFGGGKGEDSAVEKARIQRWRR